MKRIQRSRAKGWRMPPGAVYVGRPSKWGNPFPVDGPWIEAACVAYGYSTAIGWRHAIAVALYRLWLTGNPVLPAPDAHLHAEPIELTQGTKGGAAWFAGHGVVNLPLRPDLAPLRGRDLACWCVLDGFDLACHADVLLELANQ